MERRKFVKKIIHEAIIISVGISGPVFLSSCITSIFAGKYFDAVIPRPILIVIDDMGWGSEKDESRQQEPFPTGINRNHVIADKQENETLYVINLVRTGNVNATIFVAVG